MTRIGLTPITTFCSQPVEYSIKGVVVGQSLITHLLLSAFQPSTFPVACPVRLCLLCLGTSKSSVRDAGSSLTADGNYRIRSTQPTNYYNQALLPPYPKGHLSHPLHFLQPSNCIFSSSSSYVIDVAFYSRRAFPKVAPKKTDRRTGHESSVLRISKVARSDEEYHHRASQHSNRDGLAQHRAGTDTALMDIIHPINAIVKKCRPKHQDLILRCYPQNTKSAVDFKPNSSELSYLLYYATTRRSKVQKVGAYLEKATVSDVRKRRIGRVQVTLQILAALIEKSPRDLPLYSRYVLRILDSILGSDDITMVESSIPTFQAFCEHHDGASLSADQNYLKQYEEIVWKYATLASTRTSPSKSARSAPVAMRWRIAGLQAVKSVASSEALASLAGRQLTVIMPILLENLWTDSRQYLDTLVHRAQLEEKVDTERLMRRRTSISTVRTIETADTNPVSLSGSTADADQLAEEDIGVLAIQCLSKLFTVNNKQQVRAATIAIIDFIAERVDQNEDILDIHRVTGEDRGWATTIFLMVSRWTPVQDRYVILVTAMDNLVRSPLTEETLDKQLVLANMIGSLLRSDINLIGLSVMDVLLGLIQHVLRMLQLGNVNPHPQQRVAAGELMPSKGPSKEPSPSTSAIGAPLVEVATHPPSTPRIELLARLEQCIGDLATHVYYADQVSDMISAILLRLKPSTNSAIGSPVAAIEDPEAAANVIAASANLTEEPNNDGFFSFDTAKITALRAIKSIILVANKKTKASAGASLGRNRVGVRVWEGTQWLLRDPDGRVRQAYVDALLTWLDREMTKADLEAFEQKPMNSPHKGLAHTSGDDSTQSLTKRAVSNASHRPERLASTYRTSFLELLHLAVYENCLQFIDFESDIVLLHLLLTTLVNKLGVNAVKSGLPMIFRLQEDIQEAETVGKIRMGSLCHGYFWALSEKFDFESSGAGGEIFNEINRRRTKGFWVDFIRLPPVPIDSFPTPGSDPPQDLALPLHELEKEALKPYDDRTAMVELICIAYSESLLSPPNSPPTSPGRSFNHPILGGSPIIDDTPSRVLPAKVKERMLSEWCKADVISGAREGTKSVSLNGSKAGTGSATAARNLLGVNGFGNGTASGTASPHSLHHPHRSRPSSQTRGMVNASKLRAASLKAASSPAAAASDSSRDAIARVDHLKRVLSGQAPPSRIGGGGGRAPSEASSESMVSYDAPQSEFSFENRAAVVTTDLNNRVSNDLVRTRSKSRDRVPAAGEHLRPLSSNPVLQQQQLENDPPSPIGEDGDLDAIPPVPKIPKKLCVPGSFPDSQSTVPTLATFAAVGGEGAAAAGGTTAETAASRIGRVGSSRRGSRSRGGIGGHAGGGATAGGGGRADQISWPSEMGLGGGGGGGGEVVDLQTLLKGINSGSGLVERGAVGGGKVPY